MWIETKRCVIRNLRTSDLDQLHTILSDPAVMRYIQPPFDRTQTESFIKCAGQCEPPLVYALEWTDTKAVIGHVIYHHYEESCYEIGWILHRSFWGQGIASEVTAALIQHAENTGIHDLIIECSPEQEVSKHIAAKFGFSPVKNSKTCCYKRKLK